MQDTKQENNNNNGEHKYHSEFFITGIGASAGGIQALQEFFKNVPADSGIAYVVILHLSPDHDSKLAEVLQSITPIPVMQVTEKENIKPDHIYVVSPNQHLTMQDGHIIVTPNTLVEERRAPVDIFFRTLAEHHGHHAIAVILSGTGANGSMGLKRVKENGGAVFVQNPREAEYSDMPRNSIATELVDEVLNVAEIPGKIIAYKNNTGIVTIPVAQESLEEGQQAALREIFTQLRIKTGHDFSNYKRATVLRRIERRINVHQLNSLSAYIQFMRDTPEEPQALLKDLLISVTNFFRDANNFTYVETTVIPHILHNKSPETPVRIWTAGCATGEEAYSLAMLFYEKFDGLKEMPAIQIFATDIDEDAIAIAREGCYTLNDAADVSPDRLRRFFTLESGGYRIKRELREMVLFANHNVLKDPPFSHVDLITCRNMLIYLNQAAQNRVMETFHFALNPGGYLFLGSSESVDGANDLYVSVSKENQVFQSRQTVARPIPVPERTLSMPFHSKPPETQGLLLRTSQEQENRALERISLGDLHLRLLEQYAPPSVIVNENHDIVHISEKAGRYMQVKGGEPSNNILKLILQEIRLDLRTALYQALQKQSNIEIKNLSVQTNGHAENINLHVRPVLRSNDTARGFILIVFEPSEEKPASDAVQISPGKTEPLTLQLEEELTTLKAQVRSTNEHFEVQTEELKASNEELQAMNEELRSAAEELETSKEELQSINEELITVNQELKIKIEELSQSNNDFQNLINSTDIGTVFLDRYFRVKLFTPAAKEIFNLIPADIGRPLSDITGRLEYSHLLQDAEEVLKKLQTIEREVNVKGGHAYLMQVSPYRTAEDRINGVVVTFVNITVLKIAEKALRASESRLAGELTKMRNLYESSTRILITHDTEAALDETMFSCKHLLKADAANIQLYDSEKNTLSIVAQTGYPDEFIRLYKKLSVNDDVAWGRAIRLKKRIVIEDAYEDEGYQPYMHMLNAGGFRSVQSTPLFDHDENLMGVLSTHFKEKQMPAEEDLWTLDLYARQIAAFISRIKAEEALRKSEERLRITVEAAVDYAIIGTNTKGQIENWNGGAQRIFDYSAEEVMGETADLIFTDEDRANNIPEEEMGIARVKGVAADERWHLRKDGAIFFMSGVMRPIYNPQLVGYVKVARDMTDQKRNEELQRITEERYRIALQSAEMAAWDWDVRENKIVWNEQHHLVLGVEPNNDQKNVDYFLQFIHPDDKQRIMDALTKAIEITGVYREEFRITRADNKDTRWMSGFGRVVTNENGHATRMVGVMFDINDRKILEQQKDDFIGIASHELKTPVTSIKAYAEILRQMQEEEGDSGQLTLVQKLDEQVDRMVSLIRSLLDTTNLSHGQVQLFTERFDINELIKERLEELKLTTRQHQLQFISENEVFVMADKRRIGEVLTNLISNAIKYSPKGGNIIVTLSKAEKELQVSIQDIGIGIPEDAKDKIFDRFYRVKNVHANTFPGLGLGLYITTSIIELHKGKIWVESQPDKGSTFYFTLPVHE